VGPVALSIVLGTRWRKSIVQQSRTRDVRGFAGMNRAAGKFILFDTTLTVP
jgi:hypothetical protein